MPFPQLLILFSEEWARWQEQVQVSDSHPDHPSTLTQSALTQSLRYIRCKQCQQIKVYTQAQLYNGWYDATSSSRVLLRDLVLPMPVPKFQHKFWILRRRMSLQAHHQQPQPVKLQLADPCHQYVTRKVYQRKLKTWRRAGVSLKLCTVLSLHC